MLLVLLDIKIGLFKIIIYMDIQLNVGFGSNPLPISQFDTIYAENEGILVLGSILAQEE